MQPRKIMLWLLAVVIAGAMGFAVGCYTGQARMALTAGPYSDNYPPALAAIAEAKVKIQSGNTNVLENLNVAQDQIEQAQHWTRQLLGQQDGAANRTPPAHSETNQTSSAAGSGR
jgi:hypothetical protein